jgi:hypothetical protein
MILQKAAAKDELTAEERYALGWAQLDLAAAAFKRALEEEGLRADHKETAVEWSELIHPPAPGLRGELVEVSAVAEIEVHTEDPHVATIRIPPRLTLEQFPTKTLKMLETWVKDGHRLWLCNDVAKGFNARMASGQHSYGYSTECLATVKVAPNSHPLVKEVAKVLARSQRSVVGIRGWHINRCLTWLPTPRASLVWAVRRSCVWKTKAVSSSRTR